MHAVKTYGGRRGIAPFILHLNTRCNQVVTVMTSCFAAGERTPSTNWVWGWVGPPSLSWCFAIRESSLASGRNRPGSSGPQPMQYTDWCPSYLLLWVPYLAPMGIPLYRYLCTNCQPSVFSESTYCVTIQMFKFYLENSQVCKMKRLSLK